MAIAAHVIEGAGVIVPPKTKSKNITYSWSEDVIDKVRSIAHRQGRSVNETSELMMRWAIDRVEAELAAAGPPQKKRQ